MAETKFSPGESKGTAKWQHEPIETPTVPPIAAFLPSPIPIGSPQYLLLQNLGSGAFGEAFVAVLARDVKLADGTLPKSCRGAYLRARKLFVIKRFRTDFTRAD